jgi:alkylation response protein AidB-like acyl-CoA dehydrogenase
MNMRQPGVDVRPLKQITGSSEIQKNVIGERILGLPKESRADRVGGRR